MTTLIAQANPSAEAIKTWLEVLMYLGGFICTLLGGAVAVKKLREPAAPPTPQPLVVKQHAGEVSQGDLDQVHGRIKRERMELDAKIAELRSEAKDLREKLDYEIKELNDRITDVPQRTIALLRETKGLI